MSLVSSAQDMENITLQYVDLVTETMAGKFCKNISYKQKKVKPPAVLIFIDNLSVTNWYYGSTTQMSYVLFLRKRSKKSKLTSCPLSKPFVRPNQNICFNCPSNSIYNLGTQNCDTCLPGFIFDVDEGTCKHCYGEVFLINHRFLCLPCTSESGQYYNPVTSTCQTCGLLSFLNASTSTCQSINCPAS